MKIIVIVIIYFFLLSSYPISAQVNNSFIDDFFHSLSTRVYYWRIEESGYRYDTLTGFNTVVLKRLGLTDKYLFQESDIIVIEEHNKYIKTFFYHYYYFPDESEQDMKVEILLPDSKTVDYIDTQYPCMAKAQELEDIEMRIDQFSNVLDEYNTLYLEDLDYSQESNILTTFFAFGFAGLFFWGAVTEENDLLKAGAGFLGVVFAVGGIGSGVAIIRDALKVKPRRTELKNLESKLRDIINTN
jgi:hypothetical protein